MTPEIKAILKDLEAQIYYDLSDKDKALDEILALFDALSTAIDKALK